ncbi:caspase family protein [Candidatus Halobeggiatoa sp. HSG11]|nr:caspase family protein [Candidatus Halobeggiatoa sp. HSG11]
MNRLYLVFVLAVLVGCQVSTSSNSIQKGPIKVEFKTSESIKKEDFRKGVVRISSNGRQGTGFIVGVYPNEIYIVTVAHIVTGDSKPMVEFFDNQEIKAKIVFSEEFENGLTLLSVNNISNDILPLYLDDKFNEPNFDDDFFTFGFPRGGAPWGRGDLSYSGLKGSNILFSRSNISTGNSGGPVMKGNQVIGMITSITNVATVTCSSLKIREFLRGVKGGKKVINDMKKWTSDTWYKGYKTFLKKQNAITYNSSYKQETTSNAITYNPSYKQETASTAFGPRYALVIGNANYKNFPSLNSPINDMIDISDVLEELNFKVKSVKDADEQTIRNSIKIFRDNLNKETIGLFYYSGHGSQISGKNYIFPTDIDNSQSKQIPLATILREMKISNNKMNIAIIDTCRDNRFNFKKSIITKGLSIDLNEYEEINDNFVSNFIPPDNLFIAYATSPGDVARDGLGRNSPYTKYILRFIRQQGITIEQLFKKVQLAVMKDTDRKQTPWTESSLTENFYFAGNHPIRIWK